jgi:hypothetical protein
MRYRFLILFSAFFFSVQILSAQYYNTGQDPASLKWKQIKTGRFTVIYPEKYGIEGIAYAKSLNGAYSQLLSLFPGKKFTIPVIIHNYTIQSNGYVAWAPRRIELYPTPEQNTIPLSAKKQLAIHELAHVLQMESLNQSFSKGMSFLFGEQFTGVVSSLLPSWFLEGDAVFAESVLTQSGRGRTPAFQKQLKALAVGNTKPYNYDKILNGSFRDFVPDDYETGFQMVTWALLKKDPQVWNKVLKFTAEEPFTINPFNISLSRISGLRKKTLWEETFDTLKTIWTRDISMNNPVNYEVSNPDKHGKYINYYSPVYAGEDSLIAIKTSLSDPVSFVLLNPAEKKEKRILIPGQLYPWFISYAKGKLVWVETQPDPRWMNREYSVIKLMDVKSNAVKMLSRGTRYLAASVSPDGKTIVALENSIKNINKLVLIDAATGSVIGSVNTPGNVYLQHPQWSGDGKKITLIFLSESGEGIMSFTHDTREWKTLISAARNDLQSSFLKNDTLYYISSSSGTDNVYMLTPDNRQIPVTRSEFGTIDVTPAGNKILFGNYTALGNNVCSTSPDISIQSVEEKRETSSFLINRFNINPPSETDTSSLLFTPKPYRKWQHLFRFHSWMPFYADIETIKSDPAAIRPGVTVMTQNSLSTLTSTIGYEYSADRRNLIHSRVTWNGWYPVIQSSLDYGGLTEISKMGQKVADPSVIHQGISFVNTISIPLRFSTSRFSQFLQPSLSSDYKNDYIYLKEKSTYDYGQTIITGRLYFSNYDRSAIRDIYPRWAQIVDFNYCFAPFDKEIYGTVLSLKTAFYIPGVFPNNGIRIRLEREKQDPGEYLYRNFSSLPRGYKNIVSTDIQFLSVDYVLPLAYPDFNLASLLYLKRIRGGLFYDYAAGPGNAMYQPTGSGLVPLYNSTSQKVLKSFGVQMLADFHLFRIPFMITGGFQSSWKSINEYPAVEAIFNIDLFGMTLGKRKI